MAEESAPLRSLLAEFTVKVDPEGALKRGNQQVDELKQNLAQAETAMQKLYAKMAKSGALNKMGPAVAAAQARLAGLGQYGFNFKGLPVYGPDQAGAMRGRAFERSDAAGMAQFGPTRETLRAHQRAEWVADQNPGAQFGPTRDTLRAGREQMLAAEKAAAAYAQTLRGKLQGAVNAVRDGFNGGGSGGGSGPGLIRSLATVRNAMIGLGSGIVANTLLGVVQKVSRISDESKRLGVTNAEFQQLDFLAKQNTISLDGLGDSMAGLAKAVTAEGGVSQARDALKTLGVETKNSDGTFRKRNDLFFDTAIALADVADETKRAALLGRIYGEGARRIAPIIASGSDALRKQREELSRLPVLTDETIASAKRFTTSWEFLKVKLLAMAGPALERVVIPAMLKLVDLISKTSDAIEKWIKQTDLVSVAITALGAVMVARVIPGLQLMIGLGGGAARVFLTMAGAAGKAAIAFLRVALPLLAIEDFITFLRGGDSETGRLIEAIFGKDGVEFTLKAINDLKAALVDLWNWVTGQGTGAGIARLWQEFGNGITVMINDLLASVGIGKGGTNGPFKLAETIVTGVDAGTRSYINTPGAYGPPTRGGSTSGNAGTAVTIGDTSVTINGYTVADSKRIAADLDQVLERNRDALVAGTP